MTKINTKRIILTMINHNSGCLSQYVPSELGLCQNEHLEHLEFLVSLQFLISARPGRWRFRWRAHQKSRGRRWKRRCSRAAGRRRVPYNPATS